MTSIKFEQVAIDSLKDDLKLLDAKKVFLVTGKKSYTNSGSNEIIKNLEGSFEFIRFKDFEDNPNILDVEKGVNIFKENNCDCILAIGGGSSIDMAKLIKFFNPKIKPFIGKFNLQLLSNENIPLIAIPTTAGTGSEATQFAVLYVGLDKYSISDILLLPNHVAIISKLHFSQTKYQKAVSGLDAFSQAIESFWSVNSTDESRDYSLQALKLIVPNLPKIVSEVKDISAYKNMALGAYLAGKAINIAKTTAPHAFSYYLTKRFNLPHGHAVSIFLPSFIDYNFYLNNDTKTNYDYKNDMLFEELNKLLITGCSSNSLTMRIELFILSLGIEININELSIPKKEIILALKSGNKQRLKNNPRQFNFDDFCSETTILH
jgi:alcohol dehydrogenase